MKSIALAIALSMPIVSLTVKEAPQAFRSLDVIIEHNAKTYNLDPKQLKALIHVESRGRMNAKSHTGDIGLMQLNPHNIKAHNIDKRRLVRDPEYAVTEGSKILSYFKNRYEKKLGNKWISKYNCGTRRGCENWKSSKNYLNKIYLSEASL